MHKFNIILLVTPSITVYKIRTNVFSSRFRTMMRGMKKYKMF